MDEENLDLGYLYPDFHLNQATLDRIDRALLAVAGRCWRPPVAHLRETTPAQETSPDPTESARRTSGARAPAKRR